MESEIRSEPTLLKDTYRENKDKVVKIANDILTMKPSHIIILARGSSANAALYFKYLVEIETGIPVLFAYPSVLSVYDGNFSFANSVVIGVSQGGRGLDLNIWMEKAALAGAYTIAMTNYLDSPLSLKANHRLSLCVGDEKSMAATKTFLAEMLVLGMLAEALSGSTKQIDFPDLANMLEEVISLSPHINDLAGELKTAGALFIIARGVTLAVAHEAECKVQESCFLNATAYAASDFRHGPLSLIEKGTKVLFLAPADETLSDVSALFEVLDALGADILFFTTDPEMAGKAKKSLLLPKSNRYMTPFVFSIAVQLLACFLAGQKGINPDVSRNILKYTMTK